MFFMPFQVLGIWLRALLAPALLGGGIALLALWYNHRESVVTEPVAASGAPDETAGTTRIRVVHWEFGLNRETAFLLGGIALLVWSLGGGYLASPLLRRRRGSDEPEEGPAGEIRRLARPDGSELRVELHGPEDGVPLVFTHGWGLDSNEWVYAKRELGGTFRLIAWDLPGLGSSTRPTDRDWSLERLARDLDAVVALAGNQPAFLVGHSIGGMIVLTYCKLFPQALGSRVRGLGIVNSTYTNPVRTTAMASLFTALQKPVLEPLCHLMVWLSPLLRVLNWLSYLNGSAHRSTERSSFSGNETRGQLEFITRYYAKTAPDVIGRGMLAMFRYEAGDVLGRISVPTLVVTGDGDRTCLPEASRHMAAAIPGARLVTLTPARHCGLFERHREFHTALSELLTSPGQLAGQVVRVPGVAPSELGRPAANG